MTVIFSSGVGQFRFIRASFMWTGRSFVCKLGLAETLLQNYLKLFGPSKAKHNCFFIPVITKILLFDIVVVKGDFP